MGPIRRSGVRAAKTSSQQREGAREASQGMQVVLQARGWEARPVRTMKLDKVVPGARWT